VPSSPDGGRAWAALAAVLTVGAALASRVAPAALDWQPALAAAEPWRALTAAFVHFSALHLAANVAGAVLVGALGVVARVPWPTALAWLLAWPLTQASLLARPDLLHFGGLSGVLHAGAAVVACRLIVHGRGRRRAIGALVLAGMVVKVLGEQPWGPALRHPAGWDIATAPFAHAGGLVAGVLAALLVEAIGHLVRQQRGTAAKPIAKTPSPPLR
jgi:rhomboid family GlyGly-CTERM serine protease